jgi:DNA (cytosine-5)-methyltransferase 1
MLSRGKTAVEVTRVDAQGVVSKSRTTMYPIVDLFAGPGGLGEGFAAAHGDDGKAQFRSVVSIERDGFSHQTLLLRHFIRHFPEGEAPLRIS